MAGLEHILYITVIVQSLSQFQLFATPWTAACQASLSFTVSLSLLKLMPTEWVMPSNHLILYRPLLLLPSASGSFPMSQLFASCGQNIGASVSASVHPMNIQDWFPLGWNGLISLQAKGPSRVFSTATAQKHPFWGPSVLYGPNLISIHDYWKNHSFVYMDLCRQSDVSAF